MSLFIYKAKAKQKVSIKSLHGINHRLFRARKSDAMLKNIHESEFVKKIRTSFKLKDETDSFDEADLP